MGVGNFFMKTEFFLLALYDKMWYVIDIGWCGIFSLWKNKKILHKVITYI